MNGMWCGRKQLKSNIGDIREFYGQGLSNSIKIIYCSHRCYVSYINSDLWTMHQDVQYGGRKYNMSLTKCHWVLLLTGELVLLSFTPTCFLTVWRARILTDLLQIMDTSVHSTCVKNMWALTGICETLEGNLCVFFFCFIESLFQRKLSSGLNVRSC
jgi:hypothetical protein